MEMRISKHLAFLAVSCAIAIALGCSDKTGPAPDCGTPAAQPAVNTALIREAVEVLAHDSMFGRWIAYDGIFKAEAYLAKKMAAIGLEPLETSYQIPFPAVRSVPSHTETFVDGRAVPPGNVVVIPQSEQATVNSPLLNHVAVFNMQETFQQQYTALMNGLWQANTRGSNILVLVPAGHEAGFRELQAFLMLELGIFRGNSFVTGKWPVVFGANNVFFVFGENQGPNSFSLSYRYDSFKLSNLGGMLPGSTNPEEAVIFSAHFDHLGIARGQADSIYNGANDNASGVAAVLAIADHFARHGGNRRSLWFLFFNAEESGLIGSRAFAGQNAHKARDIKAVINLDMVGNKVNGSSGSAYIVGYDMSGFGQLAQDGLRCSEELRFLSDNGFSSSLFSRMDHKPFHDLGIMAHSITTFNNDNYPFYHSTADELDKVDMESVVNTARAVIAGSQTFISGNP